MKTTKKIALFGFVLGAVAMLAAWWFLPWTFAWWVYVIGALTIAGFIYGEGIKTAAQETLAMRD